MEPLDTHIKMGVTNIIPAKYAYPWIKRCHPGMAEGGYLYEQLPPINQRLVCLGAEIKGFKNEVHVLLFDPRWNGPLAFGDIFHYPYMYCEYWAGCVREFWDDMPKKVIGPNGKKQKLICNPPLKRMLDEMRNENVIGMGI